MALTDDPAEAAEALAALLMPVLSGSDAAGFVALLNRRLAALDPGSATVWQFYSLGGEALEATRR